MADKQWTKPQWDAISYQGETVLVSAAAGSGKTAVLVERVLRLLTDPVASIPANRVLIATFSNAAAAEMKQRLAARLAELIRQNPGDLFLQKQQTLLGMAQISTVHSFCLELLRKNFQKVGIPPDFILMDPTELDILKNSCAEEAVEAFYAADNSGEFANLVELLSTRRDDRRLTETVFKIYDFSRSHPFFEEWLGKKLALYRPDVPVSQTEWGKILMGYAQDVLHHSQLSLEQAVEIVGEDEALFKAYGNALALDLAQLKACNQLAQDGDWDGLVFALSEFSFARLGALRGEHPDKEAIKSMRDRVKKSVGTLAEKHLNATQADFAEDMADLHPKIQTLFALVLDFSKRLDKAKAERKALDFSDLEHFALGLLAQRQADGATVPTAFSKEIAAEYDCVLVDEYQDTNEVQDLLFHCVSGEGKNLFLVGDVKQSIYRFRQAMPEIFMEKKERFCTFDGMHYPAKIILDTNFRSRPEVTNSINYLFRGLMSKKMGEIEYSGEDELRCGAVYPEYDQCSPELHLISTEDAPEEDAAVLEARHIAGQIRTMQEQGYLVAEKGEMRPVRFQDICILLRSPRVKGGVFVRELMRQGIPAWCEASQGFLRSKEIASMLALLKAVDNPTLDVELVSAMLSPIFGFSDDEITEIRLQETNQPFCIALQKAAESDAKARAFWEKLRAFSLQAALLPTHRLIRLVLEETSFLATVQVLPQGENRRANLLLLVEYAELYHRLGYKNLSGFVHFLRRLEERGGDLPASSRLGAGADAVQVLSIHRSKGLEFPVVFLADCSKAFNREDLRGNALLHSQLGFACVRRDNDTLRQFSTVPLQAIRLETERSMLSEELRILYVALTRAKEKLILTCVQKRSWEKKLALYAQIGDSASLPPALVREGGSYADWILMALLRHPSAELLRQNLPDDDLPLLDDGNPWRIVVASPAEEDLVAEAPEVDAACPVADAALVGTLQKQMDYRYPHLPATITPAKLAVSAVKKAEESAVSFRFKSRPKFLTQQALTPAEKGNALHLFMQFCDYKAAHEDVDLEIQRLTQQAFLLPTQAESLNAKKLRGFFDSSLAQRMLAAQKLYRELRFMGDCGKDVLGDYLDYLQEGDSISLQGIADCVFVEEGGAVIVDYKTDGVKTPAQLAARYQTQLKLYAHILEKTLQMPIKACYLYSFALDSAIQID